MHRQIRGCAQGSTRIRSNVLDERNRPDGVQNVDNVRLICKSDQESSILSLKEAVKREWAGER